MISKISWHVTLGALRHRSLRHRSLLGLVIAVLIAGPVTANQISQIEHPPIKVAALNYLGTERTIAEWSSTMNWLEQSLPEYDFEFIPAHYHDLIDMVRLGQIDYLISTPGLYSLLHYEYGINLMLSKVYVAEQLSPLSLGSTLITHKDNTRIQGFDDLPGHSMAIVSKEAFGGYRLLLRELKANGIDPERQMQLTLVDFPMDNVLEEVASGQADTGVIRACVLESYPEWEQQFRVVHATGNPAFPCHVSTQLYPGWVFAGISNDRLIETRQIVQHLLEMPPHDQGSGAMYWAALSNTKDLNELFEALELGVYQPKEPKLLDYMQRYWWLIATVLFLVLCGGLYTAQVRYLVRRRTADLEQALATQKTLSNRINAVKEQAHHQTKLAILGEMSTTLAHELNQPLATIGNYARSVRRRLDAHRLSDDDLRLATTEITEQTERASTIIQGIRAFSRKRPMRLEPVDIATVCQEAIQLMEGMLSQPPPILFFNQLKQQVRLTVDPVQIQQALLNLLKNSYDAQADAHTDPAIIHLILWQGDGSDRGDNDDESDETIHISVADNGPGLSAATQSKWFEPFYTTKEQGLGLGLAVCRTIASAHGGSLSLDLVPPKQSTHALQGAVITLSLPFPQEFTDVSTGD